jgi:alpha-beta hydrolase superfamily lysophospholipase
VDHQQGVVSNHDNLELFYQRWRPVGEPRAVLAIIHGFGEHSGRYGNVVNWFVPRGHAVYALDLRGHGHSSGPRGHVDSFAEYRHDLRAFLDLVRREELGRPLFLLGHSQGGLIVLNHVLHDPSDLAGVVASGPTLGQLPVSPLLVLLAKALSKVWPRFSLEVGLDVTALSRDAKVVQAYVEDPLVHGKATARLGTELMVTIDWTQAHAAAMALPCLIIHGSEDRLCSPDASRIFCDNVTLPDKQRHEYEGHYHELFNDLDKEMVLADVAAWLEARGEVRS